MLVQFIFLCSEICRKWLGSTHHLRINTNVTKPQTSLLWKQFVWNLLPLLHSCEISLEPADRSQGSRWAPSWRSHWGCRQPLVLMGSGPAWLRPRNLWEKGLISNLVYVMRVDRSLSQTWLERSGKFVQAQLDIMYLKTAVTFSNSLSVSASGWLGTYGWRYFVVILCHLIIVVHTGTSIRLGWPSRSMTSCRNVVILGVCVSKCLQSTGLFKLN